MSRATRSKLTRSGPKPKSDPEPLLPQHQHPQPYAQLLTLGPNDDPAAYQAVAEQILRTNLSSGVDRLVQMAQDESYYRYNASDSDRDDPRAYTRMHAIRALAALGDAAAAAVAPLLPLLAEDDDDWLREELPFFFAAVGRAALEPLTYMLLDVEAEAYMRSGAGDSLAEMAEKHPDLKDEVVSRLEQALVNETEDETLAAFVICNLLDAGAVESLPLIERAFAEDRVDISIVQLPDVQEHFGLPVTAPYIPIRWNQGDQALEEEPDEEDIERITADASVSLQHDEPTQEPYVAELKVGRNEPCPCGSGKKYKKCCGAAA